MMSAEYYDYANKAQTAVNSIVIGGMGTVAIIPAHFYGSFVNVYYPDGTNQLKLEPKKNKNRTFVKIPHMYLGKKVYITIAT